MGVVGVLIAVGVELSAPPAKAELAVAARARSPIVAAAIVFKNRIMQQFWKVDTRGEKRSIVYWIDPFIENKSFNLLD
jgi:hypothetical protein